MNCFKADIEDPRDGDGLHAAHAPGVETSRRCWLGNDDPTTRRLMESILAQEEEHADDMASLLARIK